MIIVDIFYVLYLDEDGVGFSIGGVETYITQLSVLATQLGYKVRIFQFAKKDFTKTIDNAIVYGFSHTGKHNDGYLMKKAEELYERGNRYVSIIANDTLIPNYKVNSSIAIQHGIGFDSCFGKDEPLLINFLKRQRRAYPIVKRLENVDVVVCVDNNFICWYRTQTSLRNVKLVPILNFTEIGPGTVEKSHDTIKIVFARRFVTIRGTRLFTPVAKRLLENYPNIEITFAGEGPDEEYMRRCFHDNDRVVFTSYTSDKSIAFHSQFSIAVVPTLFSEGTSLSLLEAMSSHCAVVCTNVGGMTNIILDGYNGLMVSPNEEELYLAIAKLIEDSELRQRIATRAYDTVCTSFSLRKWQKKWRMVLENIL